MHKYSFPTEITFGAGAVKELPNPMREQGVNRPLIVTDTDLVKLPPVAAVRDSLEAGGLKPAVFSEIWGNPVKSQSEAGVAAFRDNDCDSIVAVGGGAALDVAKTIAVLVNHEGDLFDYEDIPGAKPIDQAIPYTVAVPTTAGTGSEVGRSAVVSDDETKIKKIIFAPSLLPSHAFIDPELTIDLPAHVTAATGMDAISHLAEAYLAKAYQPLCDGIALQGLRLAAGSLGDCVAFARKSPDERHGDANHLRVRGDMMNAAMMGAVAFQKGLGAVHSCAHALSTARDLHHGLANALMIAEVMDFNCSEVPKLFDHMEEAVGLEKSGGKNFVSWLRDLNSQVGTPASLNEAGIKGSDLDLLVEVASNDVCHSLNPRTVSSEDFRNIFSALL